MSAETLLTRAYQERQLIVVSDERFIAAVAEESKKQEAVTPSERIDWVDFTKKVVRDVIYSNPAGLIVDLGVEAFKAWSKARENGLPVLPISREQALQITFPVGHPLDRVVYIGHPAVPNIYYALADFHRRVFEHKVSEAILMLMSLGATSIQAEHISGWSHDFTAKLSLPVSNTGAKVGVDAGTTDKSKNSILFTAELSGTDAPVLPERLIWFHHEPTWQAIAEGRMRYGLRNFAVGIAYTDDFGVNLGLKAGLTKSGLELGGKFEGHESTIWNLTGQFGSGRQQGKDKDASGSPKASATPIKTRRRVRTAE